MPQAIGQGTGQGTQEKTGYPEAGNNPAGLKKAEAEIGPYQGQDRRHFAYLEGSHHPGPDQQEDPAPGWAFQILTWDGFFRFSGRSHWADIFRNRYIPLCPLIPHPDFNYQRIFCGKIKSF